MDLGPCGMRLVQAGTPASAANVVMASAVPFGGNAVITGDIPIISQQLHTAATTGLATAQLPPGSGGLAAPSTPVNLAPPPPNAINDAAFPSRNALTQATIASLQHQLQQTNPDRPPPAVSVS